MNTLRLDYHEHRHLFLPEDHREFSFLILSRDVREWFILTGTKPSMGTVRREDSQPPVYAYGKRQTHDIELTFKDDIDRKLFEMAFLYEQR